MQDDSMDRYIGLFSNYPPLTPEEEKVFEEWINNNLPEGLWKEIIDPERILQEMKNVSALDQNKEAFWKYLIEQKMGMAATEVKPIVRVVPWRRYMIAASILLALSFGGYWWLQRSRQQPERQAQMPKTEKQGPVVPGSFKARLTLSDGSVVILDSAAMGKLATQGQTSIQNNKGQLIYEGKTGTEKVLYNTLTTGKGESYSVVLGDGTKVWLNAASSLRYPLSFPGSDRKVELTGEAYFEVAKNPKQPFIALAKGMEVEVLGTNFNINSYSNEPAIKTTLVEGKVRVHAAATNALIVLEPGEQAILRQTQDDKTLLAKTKDVDVEAVVAWRFGYFQFVNADLKAVMHQLERWYDVEIVYQGYVNNDLELIGKMPRNMKLAKVLDVLQTQDVHFKLEGHKIIVLP